MPSACPSGLRQGGGQENVKGPARHHRRKRNTSNETLSSGAQGPAKRSADLLHRLLNDEEPREGRAAKRALNELRSRPAAPYYPKTLGAVESITPQIAHEIRKPVHLATRPQHRARRLVPPPSR